MMSEPLPILIPLLNPNESEALLTAVYVTQGQWVSCGDLLFSLETTKSAEDVTSEGEGFVSNLHLRQGQIVQAGEEFCRLVETPSIPAQGSEISVAAFLTSQEQPLPEGLRITQPGLALARAEGMDLSQLPIGPLVTEGAIRSLLSQDTDRTAIPPEMTEVQPPALPDFTLSKVPGDPTAILVYGGGGHGKILIDLIQSLRLYRLAGIIDDGQSPGIRILEIPILGGSDILPRLYTEGIRLAANGIGGISNVALRINIFHRLAESGFTCPAVIHPTACVERSAYVAPGTQVLAHAYLGSAARAGYGDIISTGAIVSHDCQLGNYVNISPGAILAGEVQVGDGALIGMGVTINLGVKIGAGARVGNGATVNVDVPQGGIVRAGTIWPK
jgi:acetyltransferase EpsM